MPGRKANAVWEGDLKQGKGSMKLGSGAFEGQYSYASRFEEGVGTNPEELIAAAHAGCFSMALSASLGQAGFTPTRIQTEANVHMAPNPAGGMRINKIDLHTQAQIPNIDDKTFQEIAQGAKKNCPVSQALSGVEIEMEAKLEQ